MYQNQWKILKITIIWKIVIVIVIKIEINNKKRNKIDLDNYSITINVQYSKQW